MEIKICFIDTETTGIDSKQHGLIEISAIIGILDGTEFRETDIFNAFLVPFPEDVIEESALTVNKLTQEQIRERGSSPQKVYKDFVKLLDRYVDKFSRLDKFIFAGYNARFDYDFLRTFFEKNGNRYFGAYFFFPPIDIMNLAAFHLIEKRSELHDFKLETVAKHFNLADSITFHEATSDIRVTQELFLKLHRRNSQCQ